MCQSVCSNPSSILHLVTFNSRLRSHYSESFARHSLYCECIFSYVSPGISMLNSRRCNFFPSQEIVQFLHSNGQQAMIWRCRNAIKPQLNVSLVRQHVDLYCEALGTIQTVTWFHNGTPITTQGERFEVIALIDIRVIHQRRSPRRVT